MQSARGQPPWRNGGEWSKQRHFTECLSRLQDHQLDFASDSGSSATMRTRARLDQVHAAPDVALAEDGLAGLESATVQHPRQVPQVPFVHAIEHGDTGKPVDQLIRSTDMKQRNQIGPEGMRPHDRLTSA
jgi:hypothetical protein